jgi:hypothetical protein
MAVWPDSGSASLGARPRSPCPGGRGLGRFSVAPGVCSGGASGKIGAWSLDIRVATGSGPGAGLTVNTTGTANDG